MKRSATSKQSIAVEQGIPLPMERDRPGPQYKYPWLTMAVGDSFLMPDSSISKGNSHANARTCIRNIQHRYGLRFRKKYERAGIRIWRIA